MFSNQRARGPVRFQRAAGQRPGWPFLAALVFMATVCVQVAVESPASAFKPTAEFGHVGITRDGMSTVRRTATTGESLRFSQRAINEVREANAGVDGLRAPGEFFDPIAHCDNELLPECSQRIIDLKNAAIAALTGPTPDGAEARRQTGRALHTIQDFFAHSNYVELGRRGTFSALGRTTVARLARSVQTCDRFSGSFLTSAGLTDLTTGYFEVIIPLDKCAHGVGAFGVPLAPGINKDDPSRPGFAPAREAAVATTTDFIEQILDAPGVAGNDEAIRAFMDVRGSLTFVVDTTGSMRPVIAGVKSVVSSIVSAVAGSPAQPDDYVLVPYGDPEVGPVSVTTEASIMLDAVSRLGASGGGDCPELAMTALLAAIEASQHGSTIYLFTDASAKDSNLVENVVAAATEKDISITVASSGSCSPVDPAYRTMTQRTGGQLLIHGHSEVETAKLFDLLRPTLAGDLETILLAEVEVGAATGFDVPIDSTVSAATIAIGHEGGATVQVLRPDGTEAVPSDPAVTRTDLTGTTVINLEGPEPGTWRLLVSGSAGPVTVSVKGNSPIRFDEFTPVALTEDARHEGLFPLVGASLTGKEVEARAMVLGPVSNAGFELRSPSGELLQTIDLELAGSEYVAADQHFGTFLPGEGPYRVYATGTDAAGHRVLRAFPGVTRSQPIEVTAERLPSAAPADIDTTALFRITNHGAARELLVTAADSLRSVRDVTPTTVELESGESAQVEVTMRVPAGTPDRTPFQLTVVATDTTDPEITNHTVVDLAVGSELPVACLVVDLSGTRLVGREGGVNETPAIPVDLPDGTYTITLESNDPVHGNPAQRTQPDERWVLEGLDAAGDVVLTIGPTSDIPDDQNTVIDIVGEHEMIGVVAVRARHAAPSEQYNSVEPGSARFERIGCSHSPEPAPGSRGTNPEP